MVHSNQKNQEKFQMIMINRFLWIQVMVMIKKKKLGHRNHLYLIKANFLVLNKLRGNWGI
jgi:hypothetical protein